MYVFEYAESFYYYFLMHAFLWKLLSVYRLCSASYRFYISDTDITNLT